MVREPCNDGAVVHEVGLPDDVRPISVDDHIIEPPHLWRDRLPARLREQGPRVVDLDDGTQAWALEDQLVRTMRGSTRSKPEVDGPPDGWAHFDEMIPGCYDPTARVADMDLDGVWAQLAFPDFSRFAGHRFLGLEDPELGRHCITAYNDFVVEEWCAADPERLLGLALLPFWDVPAAVAELERIAGSGIRAIAFSENPTVLGLPSVYTDHWEPLWSAIAETGLPLCMHIGSSSRLISSSPDAPPPVSVSYVGVNSMVACADWLFSGVLERHPSLSVVFSEGGAGWVPYLLEQATHVFDSYHATLPANRPPRELFAEHMYVCMLEDDTALASLDVIPNGNILWESDYPHDSGTFPHSAERLARSMATVRRDVASDIAEGNARRLFRL